jgi:hypothetical protein
MTIETILLIAAGLLLAGGVMVLLTASGSDELEWLSQKEKEIADLERLLQEEKEIADLERLYRL